MGRNNDFLFREYLMTERKILTSYIETSSKIAKITLRNSLPLSPQQCAGNTEQFLLCLNFTTLIQCRR